MCKRFVLEAYSISLRISAHSMVVCTNMKTIPFSCLTSKNLHLGIQSSDNPISKKKFKFRKMAGREMVFSLACTLLGEKLSEFQLN